LQKGGLLLHQQSEVTGAHRAQWISPGRTGYLTIKMAVPGLNRRPLKSRNTAWAASVARWLVRARVRPNQISLMSVAAAALAALRLLRGFSLPAALFIQLRLLCNLMDGMVAAEGGLRSAMGEIYNDLPDRISDALILLAAGYSLTWPGYARELG